MTGACMCVRSMYVCQVHVCVRCMCVCQVHACACVSGACMYMYFRFMRVHVCQVHALLLCLENSWEGAEDSFSWLRERRLT